MTSATQMSKTPILLCLSLCSDDLTITLFNLFPDIGVWCRGNQLLLTIKEWSDDAVEKLIGSLDCTDWDVFVDSSSDINQLTESVCGYIDFCVECTIPQKTVKYFPNNKPWITKRIKGIINRKKFAFQKNDKEEYRSVQKELKDEIRKKGTV